MFKKEFIRYLKNNSSISNKKIIQIHENHFLKSIMFHMEQTATEFRHNKYKQSKSLRTNAKKSMGLKSKVRNMLDFRLKGTNKMLPRSFTTSH